MQCSLFPDLGPGSYKSLSIVGTKSAIEPIPRELANDAFLPRNRRSASAMPCNVSPHLASRTHPPSNFSHAKRHDDTNPLRARLGTVDLFSERAIAWSVETAALEPAGVLIGFYISLVCGEGFGNEGGLYSVALLRAMA
jgi:hypothetical protein